MTLWTGVLLASLACLALKLAGWRVPEEWLAHPRLQRITALLPLCLLAGLLATQTVADGTALALDARLVAVGVAALLLWRRAPFLVAVAAAALVAALLRLTGWAA
jgi:hypothetical protein